MLPGAMRRGAACLAPLLLLACGGDGRTRVVVYSAHGADLLGEVERAFEAGRPDVDVVWQDMGADACFDRVRAERESPRADLWWGGAAFRFVEAARLGLLAPYRPTWAGQVPARSHDPGWAWAGHFVMPQVIAFHRELVPDPPRDWDDLAAERWRGRVILRDPAPSGGMKAIFGAMFERALRRDGNVDSAVRWVRGLAANRHSIAPNPAKLYDAIRRDTVGLVTAWNLTDVLYQSEEADHRVPFGWVAPASGAPMLPDGIALVARPGAAPRAEAVELYEFVTGPEAAPSLAERHRRFLVRRDLPPPAWARGLDLPAMDVDWEVVGRHVDEWERLWEEALAESR